MKLILVSLISLFATCLQAQKIADFRLQDSQNSMKSFLELKGEKLTVIDFWATWCKPCIKAIPELNIIYENYKEKGVAFISINCDGPRSIAKAIPMGNSLKINYPILLDINSDVKNQLNLSVFPTLIIINSEGKIVWVHEGYASNYKEEVIGELEKQLKAN